MLYKLRWRIELFFRWIKGHLRIKHYYGTSPNAVKTQIWIAVCTYPTLAAWIASRKRGCQTPARVNAPTFLIAELASETEGTALEVRLPGGAVARASDLEQIRLLVALIRQLA